MTCLDWFVLAVFFLLMLFAVYGSFVLVEYRRRGKFVMNHGLRVCCDKLGDVVYKVPVYSRDSSAAGVIISNYLFDVNSIGYCFTPFYRTVDKNFSPCGDSCPLYGGSADSDILSRLEIRIDPEIVAPLTPKCFACGTAEKRFSFLKMRTIYTVVLGVGSCMRKNLSSLEVADLIKHELGHCSIIKHGGSRALHEAFDKDGTKCFQARNCK